MRNKNNDNGRGEGRGGGPAGSHGRALHVREIPAERERHLISTG